MPLEDYETSKRLFDDRMALPEGHPNKWYNFKNYLEYYNMLDVEPLIEAIDNSFTKFHELFELDPMLFMTLPSIAFK